MDQVVMEMEIPVLVAKAVGVAEAPVAGLEHVASNSY